MIINHKEIDLSSLQSDIDTLQTTVPNKADLDLSNVLNSNFLNKGLSSGLAQIEFKSYTGNGKCGSSNPSSITFSFAPKVVIALGYSYSRACVPIGYGQYNYFSNNIMIGDVLTTSYKSYVGFNCDYLGTENNFCGKKSSDGKTFYWYTDYDNAMYQLNKSGYTYYFLAIG